MNSSLKHLYISPLESCNLHCKMCYTTKSPSRLENADILKFIDRYRQEIELQTITFCGGEVFLLTDFPDLINECVARGIFVQIITNGTVDRLAQIRQPNLVNLIVSIDGLPDYHDQNRGAGTWGKSIQFMQKAATAGFHLEVFSIVTKENRADINKFEALLNQQMGQSVDVTYHPRKPLSYLQKHPLSNQCEVVEGFSFLTSSEHQALGQHKSIFPPLGLKCYQISLMSDGQIYGCCEGIHPIGSIKSDVKELITNFESKIDHQLGCVEPEFVCGLKDICRLQA